MVKFLLQRPIAVLMAFTAFFIVGLVTYFTLPVSLLPDIAIPQITVQISGDNSSARELENTVVSPVRRQLLQVAGLRQIKSEVRDGAGIIRMEFDFGVNTDLAFIEVNEKIDAAMNTLPKEVARPKAIKASATDIPVLYLNMSLKSDRPFVNSNERAFLEMCNIAENVVKRRIEQLPEVAMADITGVPGQMLQIVPDKDKLAMTGIGVEDIENALNANNVEPGSMLVRDGYYEYNIRIASMLRTTDDVMNIFIRKFDRIMQLKDLCKVDIVTRKEKGRSVWGGKRAVTLAVIKQGDENMDRMKEKLQETVDYLSSVYPDVEFSVSRNQTDLLDYTISNLQQNLSLGLLFIFIVAVLFLGDVRSPLIIGISMVASIVITFFFFYLFHVSLNVISISGLILAVGMMIDSTIIVTENISQYRDKGYSLRRSCVIGTTEMITPMLSSSLTTIAVFVPLVFMSGIAGAIFMDQAFSITVGLIVSYITGIMLLPVLYLIFYSIDIKSKSFLNINLDNILRNEWLERLYDRGCDWVFSHKIIFMIATVATIPMCVILFIFIQKSRMPDIDYNELVAKVEWNENINVDENNARVEKIMKMTDKMVIEHSAYIGMQDYILDGGNSMSSSESELYFKTKKASEITYLKKFVEEKIHTDYPGATISFSPPETIFEKLFTTAEPDIVAELHTSNKSRAPQAEHLKKLEKDIATSTGIYPAEIAFRNQMVIVIDRERLLLYGVSYDEVTRVMRTAFKENNISTLRSYQQYMPISISGEMMSVNNVMAQTMVRSSADSKGEFNYIPLQNLVRIMPSEDLKSITAGKNGEYIPLNFYNVKSPEKLMNNVRRSVNKYKDWEVDFSGSFFSNKKMIGELVLILMVSLLLMYFILCAQFESFLQPLIVLLEIPIDAAFAMVALLIFGHTLNLMSAIGIIVTCGIVVNDSILKLDTMNELRKSGMPLLEAIHTAGRRRLRAIIMTSLTTIFAMVPLLFTNDIGSEMQRPLSIAMIGSMIIGTLVSLFILPLIYWFIYRKHENNEIH